LTLCPSSTVWAWVILTPATEGCDLPGDGLGVIEFTATEKDRLMRWFDSLRTPSGEIDLVSPAATSRAITAAWQEVGVTMIRRRTSSLGAHWTT